LSVRRILYETHATSVDNEAGLASGWFDAVLSPTGEEQARRLGERRRHDGLAAIWCSDLSRSYRTAEIAFEGRAIPILQDERLRECHYGCLTRVAATEIDARRAAHVTSPFPGGESYQDVVDRVGRWLDETAETHRDRTVLVIGHRAIFYALEHLMNGAPLETVVAAPWRWQPGWVYRMLS
jgi:2,3-bisphosphoglycerate-dependent phosphoglycerate mutase